MQQILSSPGKVEALIWGFPLICLLTLTGLYFTGILKGIQFSHFLTAFKLLFRPQQDRKARGEISNYSALMISLGGMIGTGNVIGVTAAMLTGGTGALFWMWVVGLLSMAIRYSESLLSLKYRVTTPQGKVVGGPMYYIEKGLGWKWLALIFALSGLLASFGIGNIMQSNTFIDAMSNYLSVNRWAMGALLALITGLVLLGGIQRISLISGLVVPLMILGYVLLGAAILILKYDQIPKAFSLIFQSAFSLKATTGGILGSSLMLAMRQGISQGLLANESGLGSEAVAAGCAKSERLGDYAVISMLGVFIDTFVVCTITGLVIIVTGALNLPELQGSPFRDSLIPLEAFNSLSPVFGGIIFTVILLLFIYTTIISWAYYGERCSEYILGSKSIVAYRIIAVLLIALGVGIDQTGSKSVFNIITALMALSNLVALVLLSDTTVDETAKYLKREKQALK